MLVIQHCNHNHAGNHTISRDRLNPPISWWPIYLLGEHSYCQGWGEYECWTWYQGMRPQCLLGLTSWDARRDRKTHQTLNCKRTAFISLRKMYKFSNCRRDVVNVVWAKKTAISSQMFCCGLVFQNRRPTTPQPKKYKIYCLYTKKIQYSSLGFLHLKIHRKPDCNHDCEKHAAYICGYLRTNTAGQENLQCYAFTQKQFGIGLPLS